MIRTSTRRGDVSRTPPETTAFDSSETMPARGTKSSRDVMTIGKNVKVTSLIWSVAGEDTEVNSGIAATKVEMIGAVVSGMSGVGQRMVRVAVASNRAGTGTVAGGKTSVAGKAEDAASRELPASITCAWFSLSPSLLLRFFVRPLFASLPTICLPRR